MSTWKLFFACLITVLAWEASGAAFETGPREVSLTERGVTAGGEPCRAIGGEPAGALASCGLSLKEREIALEKLLRRESKRKAELARHNLPSRRAITWIARAVYVEGRSLPAYGQRLLAHAIANRIGSRHWPDTAKDVVLQAKQITGMRKQDHIWPELTMAKYEGGDTEWRISVRAAWEALAMPDSLRPIPNVYHWWTPELRAHPPHWARGRSPVAVVQGRLASIHFVPGTLRGESYSSAAR